MVIDWSETINGSMLGALTGRSGMDEVAFFAKGGLIIGGTVLGVTLAFKLYKRFTK